MYSHKMFYTDPETHEPFIKMITKDRYGIQTIVDITPRPREDRVYHRARQIEKMIH